MKNATHLFIFEIGVFGATTEDEVEATAEGLKEVGLYEMPYDRDVFLQISALECVGPDVDPNHSVIYGPLGINQAVSMAIHDAGRNFTTKPDPYTDQRAIEKLKMLLIVLLATKNADKRTVENKLAKLGIGKSLRHRFAYTTTIALPRELPADADNPPKGGKVCPHLRRGHVRRQHYGTGNALEKKIWIAPVFVNADPNFVAARKSYRIAA
jgi:hypothetical protein